MYTHQYTDVYNAQYCGNFKNPNLIEVVYMARANEYNAQPFQFARQLQDRFLRNLNQTRPQ